MVKPLKAFSLFVFLIILLLGGCASVNFNYPKKETSALTDTDDTFLGKHVTELVTEHPEDQSGFFLQLDGIEALAGRIILTQRAERSIDAQYYLINADPHWLCIHWQVISRCRPWCASALACR